MAKTIEMGVGLDIQNGWQGGGDQRRIADVWLALKTTGMVFAIVSAFGVAASIGLTLLLSGAIDLRAILLGLPVTWLIFSWFIVRVWLTYHEGIVIDAGKSEISYPASDVETGLIAILTLKRFFGHGRRERLRLSSIEGVMNETRTRRGHYAVNIAGSFGSRQLVFDSKQKRDEFRAAVDWGMQRVGSRYRHDSNMDTGVYSG